ncbi:MAG: hypothetical protein CL569_19985 [Alphaproteobacteria bacterium]|nr:hypothetical protein [Alphaproteobacteria bacterium]|tara:strand:- start:1060 stop:2184 length:1125 start_codon:yes stop_codon:yes gene_type:complete
MKSVASFFFAILLAAPLGASAEKPKSEQTRQYTFAWKFSDKDKMKPRGGTTTGSSITLVKKASAEWQALQAAGLSKKEKDRRAILAMAGPYRASFDFVETTGFTEDYEPPAPYQSWGTEYVYVLTDENDFISLQHVLVMFMENKDGEESDPIVVKHWRQDWRYQSRDLYQYVGHSTWQHLRLSRRAVADTWSQAVFQVDDSPRYHSYGRWEHRSNYSSWISAETWRPLPRREFSVRDDYHTLIGFNRHTITPNGWVHTEDNKKAVLTQEGKLVADTPYIALETGLNRYERIRGHDWSAGHAYWKKTGPFWAEVRAVWQELIQKRKGIALTNKVNGRSLFITLFMLASRHPAKTFDANEANSAILSAIAPYLRSS